MATESLANGNYSQHNGYAVDPQQHNNHYAGQQSYSQAPSSANSTAPSSSNQNSDIPKDEVGWYFVEQYYTTLSKNPDRLYLYYNKRSQFVSGNETDKVQVCVGQPAINDRIKELGFQDCKVRITNVDSQASDQNIVIQVIGEISNKSQPHRKFTQTFVLATQTNGYFVLNDIFRYMVEEEDEAETQTEEAVPEAEQTAKTQSKPVADVAEPKALTSSSDPAAVEHDASTVAKVIEKKLVNGTASQKEVSSKAAKPEDSVSETAERPAEPEPTPLPSPPKEEPTQPAASSKPSAPKSWASLAASANKSANPPKAPVPALPAQRATPSAKSTTQTSAPAAAPVATTDSTPSAPTAPRQDSVATDSQDEWTAVGSSHTRQQSRQVNGQQQEGPQRRGYIKNVRENVSAAELRELLEKFGKISYFDIHQQKNCAFVDFESPEGYQAAVAANPHVLGNESFNVEERKLRSGGAPFVPRGQFQGGRGGRGDFRGGRGGFTPRGRGQGNGRGGRGGATQ